MSFKDLELALGKKKNELYIHHFPMNDSYKLFSDDTEGENLISGVTLTAYRLFAQVACFLTLPSL